MARWTLTSSVRSWATFRNTGRSPSEPWLAASCALRNPRVRCFHRQPNQLLRGLMNSQHYGEIFLVQLYYQLSDTIKKHNFQYLLARGLSCGGWRSCSIPFLCLGYRVVELFFLWMLLLQPFCFLVVLSSARTQDGLLALKGP